MVVVSLFAKVRSVAGMVAALAGLTFANPALANSAATADVTAPLRTQQAAKAATGGDEEFRRLFNGWKAVETGQMVATSAPVAAPATRAVIPGFGQSKVSIPSRMPVDGASLSSSYGMRTHPVLGGRRAHKGVDLAMPTGTPIYATADGTISRADWYSGYGLYVAIEHGGEIQTRYGHMSRLGVLPGQRVRRGAVIGYVGTTGLSTGPHLHYEMRIDGLAVDPFAWKP